MDLSPEVLLRFQKALQHQDQGALDQLWRDTSSHASIPADLEGMEQKLACYPVSHGLDPCFVCQSQKPPYVHMFDSTGLLDDPDDHPDGTYPSDYTPSPETSVELICADCLTNTGTAWGDTPQEALDRAQAWWNNKD